MVLILFAESWGTMRSLALRHGDTVMPDRELAALGLANLAAAALQGMPVGAGFSAGNANEAAGARSRGAGIIAALTLLLLVLFTTPLIAHLPKAVLAAVVIVALSHALDPGPLMRLFRLGRDGWIAVGAALCVLMLGVVDGMFIAIALSFAALLRRLANPHLARLGRLPGSHDFVEAGLHPEAELTPGIGVWRPGEPLFFGNAERALSAFDGVARASKAMRVAVLSLENTEDMDSTTLEALVECATRLRSARIKLILARVRDPIRALLRAEEADSLFAGVYYGVDDAVNAALNAMTEELAHET